MVTKHSEIFWQRLDVLLERSKIVIDRPRGSSHPRFPEIIYAIDYGYLDGTTSNDGEGVDVWLGTDPAKALDAVICTVDLDRGDAELKLMVGCTDEEKEYIERFYNEWPGMGAQIIKRSIYSPSFIFVISSASALHLLRRQLKVSIRGGGHTPHIRLSQRVEGLPCCRPLHYTITGACADTHECIFLLSSVHPTQGPRGGGVV